MFSLLPCEMLFYIISLVCEELLCEEVKNFNIRLVNRSFLNISTKILFSNAFAYIKAYKLICLYIYNIPIDEILDGPVNMRRMALLLCEKERKDKLVEFYYMLGKINSSYAEHELIGYLNNHMNFEIFLETLYSGQKL